MRHLLLCCFLAASACAADATTDEKDYDEYRAAKEVAAKESVESAKVGAEQAQLNAEIALLRKRFASAKTNAEAFKAWREQIRAMPSDDERWNNYEWLRRVETAAIKAGLTTDPKLTAVAVEVEK